MNIALRPRTIISLVGVAAVLAVAALFAVDQAKPAHAAGATFTVSIETAVGGTHPGDTAPGDGFCSIDEAIQAATNNTGSVDCNLSVQGSAAFLDTIVFKDDAANLTFNVKSSLIAASVTSGPLLIQGHTTGGATNISGNDANTILTNTGGDLSVKNVSLNHGVSSQFTGCGGGAVLNVSGSLTLDQVTVYNNSSESEPGRASALCSLGTSVTITSSSFFNNSGNSTGATIDIEAGANSISGTYIAENYPADTSGVAISGSGTTLTITNSTIVANSYNSSPFNQLLKTGAGSTMTLLNDTLQIVYQDQATPVLLFNAGTIATKNTIFASSGGGCGDGITTDSGNNLDTGDSCDLNGNHGSLENADAKLDVPSGFGGTTVLPLLSGSDAIDTGTNNGCPATDQRGGSFTRPKDGNSDGTATCDIGAYEVPADFETPTPTPAITATPSPTPTASPTPTHTPSPTPTIVPSGSATPTATPTPTPTGPTATPIPNPIQGDVNCDGVVDVFDFGDLIEFAAGLNDGLEPSGCLNLTDPETNSGFGWGDVNCDGNVDALDALFVLEFTADLHTLTPVAQNCFAIGDVMT